MALYATIKVPSANMPHPLTIRNAEPHEYDDVARVILAAYQEFEDSIPPDAWAQYSANMQDVRSRLVESELLIAVEGDEIAGSATFYHTYMTRVNSEWPQAWTGVRLIGVTPESRGRGVGKALVEECIRRSREQDAEAIALHTTPLMTLAQGMYERMGFERIPQYDFRPRDEFVVMAYKLSLRS